jgi:hypothetical protein
LIKNHPDFEKLTPHITFMPELSYLHSNLMEIERVNEISNTIQLLKADPTKYHAFIVSGGPNHWISLFVESFSPTNMEISIADSSLSVGLPKIVSQFIDCFTTKKSFGEFFSESIFLGFMKEYQEEALKLLFDASTSGSATNDADQLEALQSLNHSLKEVMQKIERIDMMSRDLDELICEMSTNLVNLTAPKLRKLNEELFQEIPNPHGPPTSSLLWDFMHGKFHIRAADAGDSL